MECHSSMKKFFAVSFVVLISIFAFAMFFKSQEDIYFYLSSNSPSSASATMQSTDYSYVSCEPRYAVLQTAKARNATLEGTLNWLFSYKTPKVAGYMNPFYASALTAEVTQDETGHIINITGTPILESECLAEDFKVLIQQTVQHYLKTQAYEIRLNNSAQAFQNFSELK